MSFPNIPDIDPCINIKSEDAINLLLTSIAMEEVSLSKLMDAETNKILCILDNCGHHNNEYDNCSHDNRNHDNCNHNNSLLHDAIEINKSVDGTIKDIIKLQMLLQFKLDNIIELLPEPISTTHTTTCTTSTCSTTTKKNCCCSLTGIGKGCVPNCCDKFHKHTATLYSLIYCRDIKNRTIRYCVENDDASLGMHASGYNVKIQYPCKCSDKLVIYGKGHAEKKSKCKHDKSDRVDFILTVCKKTPDNIEFRMEIRSVTNPKLNHDSGFVQVRSAISNLRLIIYS